MSVITNDNFWDCECDTFYIHNKSVTRCCPVCGAHEEDMPDSHQSEIDAGMNFAKY